MKAEEMKETVTNWLNGLAADFYDDEIIRFMQRLDKWLNRIADYLKNRHVL
jgi:hypothetical protein